MKKLNVIDFCSGLRGWSQPFIDAGHNVFCVELDERFPADHRDLLTFKPSDLPWDPSETDIILASPPCTSFSIMSVGTHWTHDNQPKTDTARMGIRLVRKVLELVKEIKPKYFIIENPRAKLRKMDEMQDLQRQTVTYCQYGDFRMKPTDLWGHFPEKLVLKPICKNRMPCHAAAPRGSHTGTQGMDKYESAKIPRLLAEAVMKSLL